MPEEEKKQASWELEKKIPLALIIALIGQFVLGVWWASDMNSRIRNMEAQLVTVQSNYLVLNTAREASILAQTRTDDKVESAIRYLQVLQKRSDILHPEFQDDPRVKP